MALARNFFEAQKRRKLDVHVKRQAQGLIPSFVQADLRCALADLIAF